MKRVSLEKAVNISLIQSFQDAFSDFSGLSVVFTDTEGAPITKCSRIDEICGINMRNFNDFIRKYLECFQLAVKKSVEEKYPCIYKCHTGLYNIAVPVMMNDVLIGIIIAGQALCSDEEQFDGYDFSEYETVQIFSRTNSENIPCLSMAELRRIADFLYTISKIISGIATDNRIMLKNSRIPDYEASIKVNRNVKDLVGIITSNKDAFIARIKQILESYGENDSEKISQALQEAFSDMRNTVDNISGNFNFFSGMGDSDVLYMPREIISKISKKAEEICEIKNLECVVNISEDIPYRMLGKKKLIQYAVETLISLLTDIVDCTGIELNFSVSNINYSCSLVIEIITIGSEMTEEQINNVEKGINERAEIRMKYSDNMTQYSAVTYTIMDKLSGRVKLKNIKGKGASSCIVVPQLAVRGDN